MTLGLVGCKVGMIRVLDEQGVSVPVTALDMPANRATQARSKGADGYAAVQVILGQKKANRINKAEAGHSVKAGAEAGRGLIESVSIEEKPAELKVSDEIIVSMLGTGQLVDVTGTSKGKGFSGTIKRHNFGAQCTPHGNSRSHRALGSIGMVQDPGCVLLDKRMAGQYDNTKATVQKPEVVRVDAECQLLSVKGAVSGAANSDVVARPSMKVGV